jgi:hypothetical protein
MHQAAPTSKDKNAMLREVTRLLDELAPERTNARSTQAGAAVKQHRSPNGCILQADAAALTVTFYAQADDQDRVGELQIVLWRGVVSRRGAVVVPNRKAAEVVRQEVVNPIEAPTDGSVWRSRDGSLYTTAALAAHCLALLDQQIAETPQAE